MLSRIKYFFVFALLISFSTSGKTQVSGINIPKDKFLFIQQMLDSLPIYSRMSHVSIYPACMIKEHDRYHLKSIPPITFSAHALSLPKHRKESYINMHVLNDIATNFYLAKNYDSSSWYWFRAIDTAILYHFDGEELHDFRMALNNNCFLIGDYTGAMEISTKGLEKAEQVGDITQVAHFNNVIGYIYMKLGDLAKSKKYFLDYLEQAGKLNDSLLIAHAQYNLGDLSIAEKNYDQAIGLFNESMKSYSSITSFSPGRHKERKAYVSNKLAQCWKLKGHLEKAIQFIRDPLEITSMMTSLNEYDKAEYFINGADIYNRLGKPDSALVLLKKGIGIAAAINHREFTRDALEQIAISFSLQKKFDSAFYYQSGFLKLKDSILNEISREEIYQQENDLQLERQQQLQKMAIQRQKLWRNIIIGVGVLLLIIVVFLYNRHQLRQKNKYQQALNRQQNELFNAIAAAQDQERKRIAQDIHDSLGSILSAAKLKLSSLNEIQTSVSPEHSEKYQTAMDLLDEASSELRSISHNIMPATLSKLGLIAALKNLTGTISSPAGLAINFISHGFKERIPEQMEISIYRIILELINNIVKHAKAEEVTIQLIRYPDHINVTVEDNGKGFDYSKALQEKKGIGLGNILSRVEYLKGVINVDAVHGRGTTVIIEVPLQDGKE